MSRAPVVWPSPVRTGQRSCGPGVKRPRAERRPRSPAVLRCAVQVRNELERERARLEAEVRDAPKDMLCATPFGVDVVGITEFIALTGALVGGELSTGSCFWMGGHCCAAKQQQQRCVPSAPATARPAWVQPAACSLGGACCPGRGRPLGARRRRCFLRLPRLHCVGWCSGWPGGGRPQTARTHPRPFPCPRAPLAGLSARRRKEELERLNEQLRTINTQLRQQARAGTLYAPGLTYAPPTTSVRPTTPMRLPEPSPVAQDAAEDSGAAALAAGATVTVAPPAGISYFSDAEDEMSPGAKQCLQVRALLHCSSAGHVRATKLAACTPRGCLEGSTGGSGPAAPNPRLAKRLGLGSVSASSWPCAPPLSPGLAASRRR